LTDSIEIEICELDPLIENKKQLPHSKHNYGCEILSAVFILTFFIVLMVVILSLK
jgi:hypothetical protein